MSPSKKRVAVLVGSLRKESLNRKMALALASMAPPSLQLEIVEIGPVLPYNQDDDDHMPAPNAAFKRQIEAAEAFLFITPEYNRSVPGVLKNAIDVASRPYGQSAWSGKPGAVITLSPGAIGGALANHALRQSLVFLDVPAMAQPEAYIGGADKLFGDDGSLTNPKTREFMQKYLAAFEQWVERHARPA